MSEPRVCPRCRRSQAAHFDGRLHRCPGCDVELIAASAPREAEVRKYLYGPRLLPLARTPDRAGSQVR